MPVFSPSTSAAVRSSPSSPSANSHSPTGSHASTSSTPIDTPPLRIVSTRSSTALRMLCYFSSFPFMLVISIAPLLLTSSYGVWRQFQYTFLWFLSTSFHLSLLFPWLFVRSVSQRTCFCFQYFLSIPSVFDSWKLLFDFHRSVTQAIAHRKASSWPF